METQQIHICPDCSASYTNTSEKHECPRCSKAARVALHPHPIRKAVRINYLHARRKLYFLQQKIVNNWPFFRVLKCDGGCGKRSIEKRGVVGIWCTECSERDYPKGKCDLCGEVRPNDVGASVDCVFWICDLCK